MQGIIKIRGAPIDGCPDEQKKLSMKNRPLARPKALAVFLCGITKPPRLELVGALCILLFIYLLISDTFSLAGLHLQILYSAYPRSRRLPLLPDHWLDVPSAVPEASAPRHKGPPD